MLILFAETPLLYRTSVREAWQPKGEMQVMKHDMVVVSRRVCRGWFERTLLYLSASIALHACGTSGYAYQSHFQARFVGGEEPDAPSKEARELLRAAKTVAFYPPDTCLNATPTETFQDKVVRARCGVLLSRLERDAERAGYEVVSWVNLRGTQRPIDYAREARVDVLFEINELSPQRIAASDAKRELFFFRKDEKGLYNHDLVVSADVAKRCYEWARQREQTETAGIKSTLDIKTVSVADGRARWHYRNTVTSFTGLDYAKTKFVGEGSPDEVLCVEKFYVEPKPQAARSTQTEGSRHTFDESSAGSVDEQVARLIDKLAEDRVREFIGAITSIRNAQVRANGLTNAWHRIAVAPSAPD